MRIQRTCVSIVFGIGIVLPLSALADRPTLDMEIDGQIYDFRIETKNEFTIENDDVSVTVKVDRDNQRIEIATNGPNGLTIAHRAFPKEKFDNRNDRSVINQILDRANVRVNGKGRALQSYFSQTDQDLNASPVPKAPASGETGFDIAAILGISTAHASACSDICESEIVQLGFTSAAVVITCASATLGGPTAWLACAVSLGAEVWAADQLADCVEEHPAQCRVFFEQE